MTLAAGTRLGSYEIVAPLGAGGMGEVYKARDTRLDRAVAIKVLPPALAADPQFRERFEREARAISALEHPNICAVYDVGTSGHTDFLVMQYLEGETVVERLAAGPLPLDEAMQHAIEVAGALDKAHSHGFIHRDLKPGNIMLARSGKRGTAQAKLLDFGLAKGVADRGLAGADVTATRPLTAQGTIVGTFQYMAPEQIEGHEADARSDIWGFGCVLYEMLTGRHAFEGKSHASLIGSIMKDEPPPIDAVQPVAPRALDHVVRRCLAKDPDDRWQHIRDARAELLWIQQGGAAEAPVATARRAPWVPWAIVALALAAIPAIVWKTITPGGAPPRPIVLSVLPPEGAIAMNAPAVSPDGARVVFVALGEDGVTRLWLRATDQGALRMLPQTDDAVYPFWSYDGTAIGFFAHGKLKITTLEGAVREIATAPLGRGGDWNADGLIIFAPEPRGGIYKVRAEGGPAEPVTRFNREEGARTHRNPVFLPGGRRFLFYAQQPGQRGLASGSIDGGEATLIAGGPAAWAEYEPSGHLVFRRGATLVAQAFDPERLTLSGEAFTIADNVEADSDQRGRSYSVSPAGVIAVLAQRSNLSVLTWVDREGSAQRTVGPAADLQGASLSRDAGRIAVSRRDPRTGRAGIWLLDALRGTGPRFSAEKDDDSLPVWSADGEWIAFRRGDGIYRKSVTSGREEELISSAGRPYPISWSDDGRYLFYVANDPARRLDLFMLPLDDRGKVGPLIATDAQESDAELSPDGRWLAFVSDQTGRREVWVQRFPSDGAVWPVSTNGGWDPSWSADGRELFYVPAGRPSIIAVPVTAGATFEQGPPKTVVTTAEQFSRFGVAPKADRFLLELAADSSAGSVTMILNWPAVLTRK